MDLEQTYFLTWSQKINIKYLDLKEAYNLTSKTNKPHLLLFRNEIVDKIYRNLKNQKINTTNLHIKKKKRKSLR